MGNYCCSEGQHIQETNTVTRDKLSKKKRAKSSIGDSSEEEKDGSSSLTSESIENDSVNFEQKERIKKAKTIDINKVYEGWRNALIGGNESLVMYLYSEHGNDIDFLNHTFDNGDYPLHVAVFKNNLDMAMFLLNSGHNVNIQNNKTGDTALHYAVREEYIPIVRALLSKGATPSICNYNGESPISLANSSGNEDISDLLQPENAKKAQKLFKNDDDDDEDDDDLKSDHDDDDNKDIKEDNKEEFERDHSKDHIYLNPSLKSSSSRHNDDGNVAIIKTTSQSLNSINNNNPSLSIQSSTSPSSISSPHITLDQEKKLTAKELENNPLYGGISKSLNDQQQQQPLPNKNPFNKSLKRASTRKLMDNIEHINVETKKLPKLEGWLEKKKPTPPYSWQKRWVIVKNGHILWSDKPIPINDPTNREERKKFNGSLNIMQVSDVKALAANKGQGRKFQIIARDGKRQATRPYEWKAPTKEDRDYWVSGLQEHKKHSINVLQAFEN